jgi:hypothetical protein
MPGTMQTVLTQDMRPAGTYYTNPIGSASSPLVLANGVTSKGLISDADAGDATKKLGWAWEFSFDGVTFAGDSAATPWVGGNLPIGATVGPPWTMPGGMAGFNSSGVAPIAARVRIELPQPLSFGWQLGN